jgi:hypothetical protein
MKNAVFWDVAPDFFKFFSAANLRTAVPRSRIFLP